MTRSLPLFTVLFAACLMPPAFAPSAECDCSQRAGNCKATGKIDVAEQSINFRSGTDQCIQITYSVDGEPSSVTIRGGSGAVDYLITNRSKRPRLDIDSCTICRDPERKEKAEPRSDGNKPAEDFAACTERRCRGAFDAGIDKCLKQHKANSNGLATCSTRVMEADNACMARCAGVR